MSVRKTAPAGGNQEVNTLPSFLSCPHMSSHGSPLAKGCRRLLESSTVGQVEWGAGGLPRQRMRESERIWTLWGWEWGWRNRMLSDSTYMVLLFIFKSLIHWSLSWCVVWFRLYLFPNSCPFVPMLLITKFTFTHWLAYPYLWHFNIPCTFGSISGFFFCFIGLCVYIHVPICISYLMMCFKNWETSPSSFFFYFRVFLSYSCLIILSESVCLLL